MRPGNSAATVTLENNVGFGSGATLQVELGGVMAGVEYDRLRVVGDLSLDGALVVSLIDGFTPSLGQAFDVLDWGTLTGKFSTINLPVLPGLAWNTSQLYATGVLSVTPAFEADFDEDGDVDGDDLVNWSAGFGASGAATQRQGDAEGDQDVDGADFLTWQRQLGGGATASAFAKTVPEPAPLWLAAMSALAFAAVRTKRSFPRSASN